MGYMHINNLYKDQRVLLTGEEVYALEKVHGTSAHIKYYRGVVSLFSGGASAEAFRSCAWQDDLAEKFAHYFPGRTEVIIFGEAYGGKMQGMSKTYGKELRFVAFDVRVEGEWLTVPDAAQNCYCMGIEFVPWERGPNAVSWLDQQRDIPSRVAERRGLIGIAEGIVIRPIIEQKDYSGERVIAKHKRTEFIETKTPREVDPAQQLKVEAGNAAALEWVTEMRLDHVLDKLPTGLGLEGTRDVINAMVEDVMREGAGEIEDTKETRKAIGTRARELFHRRIMKITTPDAQA